MIPDCPITTENIKHADTLFGPDLATIRGKTVRRKPTHVVTDYVDIPRALVDINKQVTLAVDVMFVNSVPLLVSVSRMINLIAIEHAPKCNATKRGDLIQHIIRVYARAGFTVQTILMDNEFKKLKDHVPMLALNIPAVSEHVGDIEQRIRVVKKRTRGLVCTLPYPRLPQQMLIHMIHFVTMWLNNFPTINGISPAYSLVKSFSIIACRTNDTVVLHLVHTEKCMKTISLQTQCTLVPSLQFALDLLEIFKVAITSSTLSAA